MNLVQVSDQELMEVDGGGFLKLAATAMAGGLLYDGAKTGVRAAVAYHRSETKRRRNEVNRAREIGRAYRNGPTHFAR
ncbi:MAG: hypothetical protein ACLFNQ_12805 [Spirochaetaceae bacterium]